MAFETQDVSADPQLRRALRTSGASLTIGPFRFLVKAQAPAAHRHILSLYRGYPLEPSTGLCDACVTVGYTNTWRGRLRRQVALRSDVAMPFLPMPAQLAPLSVEMGMNWFVATASARHVLLHASVVERSGRAIIASGDSGSGKSTLGAILGSQGWRFFADEFGMLDPGTGQVWPYPRPCSLKNQSIAEVERFATSDRFSPLYRNTPRGDVRFLRPTDDAIARMHEPAKPALLLFPTFTKDQPAHSWRMRSSEAFARLINGSPNYETMGEDGFRCLTQLVLSTPAFGLRYGSTEQALDMVDQAWASIS
jgi:HprK-related kinase A